MKICRFAMSLFKSFDGLIVDFVSLQGDPFEKMFFPPETTPCKFLSSSGGSLPPAMFLSSTFLQYMIFFFACLDLIAVIFPFLVLQQAISNCLQHEAVLAVMPFQPLTGSINEGTTNNIFLKMWMCFLEVISILQYEKIHFYKKHEREMLLPKYKVSRIWGCGITFGNVFSC